MEIPIMETPIRTLTIQIAMTQTATLRPTILLWIQTVTALQTPTISAPESTIPWT